jgi:predicted dehydrogenase
MHMWLVGAGYWGSKLLTSLKKFDVDATVLDIRNGQSIEDIDNTDPVILATPLWQHYEQATYILDHGNDLYVEKPLAETANQVREIAYHINDDQLLMVGHIFEHHPQGAFISKLLDRDEIGEVKHITSERANWGIYQTKTDPILSLATHDISIITSLVEGKMYVDHAQEWRISNTDQPDRVWFSGHIDNVTYTVDVSWHSPVRRRLTVIQGTTGQIIWDQDANTVTVVKNQIVDRRAVKDDAPVTHAYNALYTPLECELLHWVNCCKTREEPKSGLHRALKVARIIDAVKTKLGHRTF